MIRVFENHNEFLQNYEEYFKNDEIKYGLIWGISKRDSIVTLMISSEIDDKFVVGVLAGQNLLIASNTLEKDVYRDLVIFMNDVDYPGIIGLREHCDVYSETFSSINNKQLINKMNQRIYYCNEVTNFSLKKGLVRLAQENDIDLLTEWGIKFAQEAEGYTPSRIDTKNNIESKIAIQSLYVLEDKNQVVSMAMRARSLNKTESVGYVYTPQNYRGNGYASLVVEDVTRKVLDDNKIPTLYTDLSNPISNSIYMKIGYKPYCDSVMMNKQ